MTYFRSYRYAAYRVATFLLAGRLGKRRRRPLPACLGIIYSSLSQKVKWPLVSEIRKKFPSPDDQYTGFSFA